MRRRRKKKRSLEKEETEDSGYFNGPDSSTETSSDEDRGQLGELGMTLKLGDEKEVDDDGDAGDVDHAEVGAVTIEFGDVQEILDELSRETNTSETEQKADSEIVKERREVTSELTLSKEENRDQQEESSLKTEEPETKQKRKSTKKRTKITKITSSQTIESKEASLLSGLLFDFKWKAKGGLGSIENSTEF